MRLQRSSGRGRERRASILREGVVGIAIEPAFAWLGGNDDRVTRRVCMFARMPVWRAVATKRDSAFLAGAQMDPAAADLNAFLAFEFLRLFEGGDRVNVCASIVRHVIPFLVP